MGRPSARERIINAATEVFCRRGYGEATTREISERAQIAEITLFRNFDTKKKLYFEVVGQIRGQLSEIAKNLNNQAPDDGTMLKNLLVDRLAMADKNSRLLGLLVNDMQYHDEVREEFAGIYRELLEALTGYLNHNFLKSSRDEARFAARYFIWLIMGSVVNKNLLGSADGHDTGDQYPADQSGRIIEMFLNGIKNGGLEC